MIEFIDDLFSDEKFDRSTNSESSKLVEDGMLRVLLVSSHIEISLLEE